jgi:hypothetical protein
LHSFKHTRGHEPLVAIACEIQLCSFLSFSQLFTYQL